MIYYYYCEVARDNRRLDLIKSLSSHAYSYSHPEMKSAGLGVLNIYLDYLLSFQST